VICLVFFAMYVRSVPPKVPKPKTSTASATLDATLDPLKVPPDFLSVDTSSAAKGEPSDNPAMVKEALDEATEALMDLDDEEAGETKKDGEL
jgi:hypothetical protein